MPLATSLAVAALTWHTPALPDGQVVTDPTAGLAFADTSAWTIHLRSDWRRWDPAYLCTVVVHEVGHLAGQNHSADPANVMYPVIERIYWRCERTFNPPLRRRPKPD